MNSSKLYFSFKIGHEGRFCDRCNLDTMNITALIYTEKTQKDPRRPEKTRKDPKRRTYLYREDPKRRTYLYREDPKRPEKTRKDPKRHPKRPEKTQKDPKRHPKLSSNNSFDKFCAKPRILQRKTSLQNENRTINKKVMGVLSPKNGVVVGKNRNGKFTLATAPN